MTESNNTKERGWAIFDLIGLGAIVLGAITLLSAMIHQIFEGLLHNGLAWAEWPITIATAFIVALIAVHFVLTFTRDLNTCDSNGGKGNSCVPLRKLRMIFMYGYIFMFVALGACLAPFFLSIETVKPSQPHYGADIVLAYASKNDDSNQNREPQWFLHIGSTMSMQTAEQTAKEPDAQFNAPKPDNTLSGKDAERVGENSGYPKLEGGLAVPLYVVLLALAGGAVSLTRRLPEYQRQATGNGATQSTDTNRSPISAVRARELVIFQIMQVYTAPLIAIVAFAVFNPDTELAGALLGFLSGFSSETILLRLRKMADALSGQKKRDTENPPADANAGKAGGPGSGSESDKNNNQQKQGDQNG